MLERQNGKTVSEDPDDNRGHTVQQISRIAHDEGGGGAAKLRKIDGAEKADRHAHEHRQHKQLSAADNGVGHTTAGFAHRGGQLGKEVPAHGSPAVDDQVTEDQEKHGDGHHGANTGHRKHKSAYEFAPAEASRHACPSPVPRLEVTTIMMRARPLRIKVSRKSTRPNSINDCV